MQKKVSFQLLPEEAADEQSVRQWIAAAEGVKPSQVKGFYPLKQSIDARSRQVKVNLTVQAFIDEPFMKRPLVVTPLRDVTHARERVVIIGAGPAGLFAALQLISAGIKPVILERGKNVRDRRRDLARLNKEGIIDENSNYCFGEGGAGTYSDGKLYTRSSKRGDINKILNYFVQFGAEENILYESHPHIGTNKLPGIITEMRNRIIDAGGEFHFNKKVIDLHINRNSIESVSTADGDIFRADAFILATGHSARDIFFLLTEKKIHIEAKPFALGVRIEHPQQLIDSIQYHCPLNIARSPALPAASYQLVEQVNEKGVFSFCMCPGGIIATASTAPGELVVNGWSPSKRNNPYANSGIVVQVENADAIREFQQLKNKKEKVPDSNDPLLLMHFQSMVEKKAFAAGGGNFKAPAQRMTDFVLGKSSSTLPDCSYIPGLEPALLGEVLPGYIYKALQQGFKKSGSKLKGYFTNEAVVVATESRTSSPVRIPRDNGSLLHPQFNNFYPCGEGAGFAGGIVSAAMDGERIATVIAKRFGRPL
jgi:uncharacterized FAD-dependent dehydrogenase